MWRWQQSTGNLYKDEAFIFSGYSGHGEGVNNPLLQQIHNVGPLPLGLWEIMSAFDSSQFGECVMRLLALEDTNDFGRGGFLIHGDEKEFPGEHKASHGCLVLPLTIRQQIAKGDDKQLLCF